jgi:small subunit ribosomal protein S2
MSSIDMQALLEAGMHFGHLTRRWNPKMKPFIYGVRNGIHIIDLSKTAKQLSDALDFISNAVGEGADVLFVGTKKQAQDLIREAAEQCQMYYVNRRWLGGTLTNWRTIKSSIDRLNSLQRKREDGTFNVLSKKELLMIDREIQKLDHSLGGIRKMTRVPGVIVLIDPGMEHIALHEANILGIPLVALGDTNCDPDPIEYLVAGNDDALRSIELFLNHLTKSILEGLKLRESKARQASVERKKEEAEKPETREVEVGARKAETYVGDLRAGGGEEEAAAGTYSAKVVADEEKEELEKGESEESAGSDTEKDE